MNSESDRSPLSSSKPNRRELLILAAIAATTPAHAKHKVVDPLVIVDGWVMKKSEIEGFSKDPINAV